MKTEIEKEGFVKGFIDHRQKNTSLIFTSEIKFANVDNYVEVARIMQKYDLEATLL
jgi:hypothetical protein